MTKREINRKKIFPGLYLVQGVIFELDGTTAFAGVAFVDHGISVEENEDSMIICIEAPTCLSGVFPSAETTREGVEKLEAELPVSKGLTLENFTKMIIEKGGKVVEEVSKG